jgi:hypothetical protein
MKDGVGRRGGNRVAKRSIRLHSRATPIALQPVVGFIGRRGPELRGPDGAFRAIAHENNPHAPASAIPIMISVAAARGRRGESSIHGDTPPTDAF